jgi:hypothetical protein
MHDGAWGIDPLEPEDGDWRPYDKTADELNDEWRRTISEYEKNMREWMAQSGIIDVAKYFATPPHKRPAELDDLDRKAPWGRLPHHG